MPELLSILLLGGLVLVTWWAGIWVFHLTNTLLTRPPERRGFEVKQTTGGRPVTREDDHG